MALDVLEGTVSRVVYNAGAYYILDINVSGGSEYRNNKTAKGNVFGLRFLSEGVPLRFLGRWVNNQRYGRQFQIRSWELWGPTVVGIRNFLSTCVEGFDYMTATFLMERYGLQAFDALKDPAKVLEEVTAANPADLQAALAGWERCMAIRALADVLKDGGLSSSDVDAAVRKFGSDAPAIVRENPYRLMEIPGFDFEKTDRLASTLGIQENNPVRLEGAALWALNEAGRSSGHLFLPRGVVATLAETVKAPMGPLPTSKEGFRDAIQNLVDRKAVIVDPEVGAYLPEYFNYERLAAQKLAELMAPATIKIDFEPFLEEFERVTQLTLSEAQKEAVRSLVQHRVLTLTGLPGTGKTTSVKALVRLFEVTRVRFSLMAPTGIASKRLSHVTGHAASTIHRALGFDGVSWAHNENNKYVTDAVIVDEMSMVDQELFYRLLCSLRKDTLLVLVGDDAQLPSVGPGNVLKELVACPAVPSVRLTQIFRQEASGDIVSNSHKINRGQSPVLGDPKSDSEFKYIRLTDEYKIRELIVKIAQKLKARDANFQVLSPKYDGIVGVNSLNEALREVLNPPGPPEWKGKFQHFRVGDRIMVVKNDYKKGVYNGDVGKLLYASRDRLLVRIYGVNNQLDTEVSFTESEADEVLRPAYAITAHKSQGNEFDTVIMPVVGSQGRMLQRNLLYTAVTRAKKTVWLLGEESAILKSIENNKVTQRNTALSKAISNVVLTSQAQVVPSEHV